MNTELQTAEISLGEDAGVCWAVLVAWPLQLSLSPQVRKLSQATKAGYFAL